VVSEPVGYPSRRQARALPARHARRRPPLSRPSTPTAGARHATPRGDGFTRLVSLTSLGAVVPGSSMVAGGMRRSGWALVSIFVLGLLAIAAVLLRGNLTEVGLQLATRPNALLALAVLVAGSAVVWCAAILVGHVSLRRGRLTAPQRVLSAVLVAALMGLIALPSATAARYALAQRSLILTVFDEEHRDAGLASPDMGAEDPWANHERINVLLLGSDAGPGRTGTRPDTMIVASIDTRSGDVVLFSLPRNLEGAVFPEGTVEAEEFPDGFFPSGAGNCEGNDCHLNALWLWGEQNADLFPESDNPGLQVTRDGIGGVLGLQLDYYAIVNLQGFEDLVNAIGGVEMDVERRIPIGGGTNMNTGGKYPITGYIEPGNQRLDGYHALWYARSREGSDDYDRMKRQRCVIAAVSDQAAPAKLARAFPELASSAEKNVFTDIRGSELSAFVDLALRVQQGSIRSVSFDRSIIKPENPDFDEMHQIVQKAITPAQPAPGGPATDAPTADATGTPTDPTSPATTDGTTTGPDATSSPTGSEPTSGATTAPDEAVDVQDVCGVPDPATTSPNH